MKLPGLPGTKAKVIARATSEGWNFIEAKGVGGTKRLYEVPAVYLYTEASGGDTLHQPMPAWGGEAGAAADTQGTSLSAPRLAKVAGTIAGGTGKVDLALLDEAMRVLREWEKDRQVEVGEDRRSAIVAILYDYLQNATEEGDDAIAVVLRAIG